jgi:hypothetical protein
MSPFKSLADVEEILADTKIELSDPLFEYVLVVELVVNNFPHS